MWREIKKNIHRYDRFLIATHVNPDADGLGSSCALAELLLLMGKECLVLTDCPLPAKFKFLDYHHKFEVYDRDCAYADYPVLIVLDTHSQERLGDVAHLIDKKVTLCIDHHKPSGAIFTPLAVIDATACSVGAMIYTLYKEFGYELNTKAATGIYASVLCDTGRFSYASTNRKAHKIADECIKQGVDPDEMYSRLFQHVSLAEMKMFAKALQHMEIHLNNKVVIQQILYEDYHNVDGVDLDIEHIDLEYFNDFNKMIEDIECIVLLRELPEGYVRVSLRSKSDLDLYPLVQKMGGGGHSKAAGLTYHGPLADVKVKILGLLTELFNGKNTEKKEFSDMMIAN